MCFTVQLSRFLSVFDSFDILSYRFELVKNFFYFYRSFFLLSDVVVFATAILDYHIFSDLSTTFLTFFKIFGSFISNILKLSYQLFPYRSCSNLFILSQVLLFVNNFFIIFRIVSNPLKYYDVFCHLSATARL